MAECKKEVQQCENCKNYRSENNAYETTDRNGNLSAKFYGNDFCIGFDKYLNIKSNTAKSCGEFEKKTKPTHEDYFGEPTHEDYLEQLAEINYDNDSDPDFGENFN